MGMLGEVLYEEGGLAESYCSFPLLGILEWK